MMAAVEAGGTTVEYWLTVSPRPQFLGSIALAFEKTAYSGFLMIRCSIPLAMQWPHNIYALADYALVVSSTFKQGGPGGATEALERGKSVPVFVRSQGTVPEGNHQLIKSSKAFPEEPGIVR